MRRKPTVVNPFLQRQAAPGFSSHQEREMEMTQPDQNTGTNPPNPHPPHAPNPGPQDAPPPRPVVVNTDSGVNESIARLAESVRALPETLLNGLREGLNVPPPPASTPPASTSPPSIGTGQPPAGQQTHTENVEKSGYKGPSRVAKWWLGIK